jgi:hypothetical protein
MQKSLLAMAQRVHIGPAPRKATDLEYLLSLRLPEQSEEEKMYLNSMALNFNNFIDADSSPVKVKQAIPKLILSDLLRQGNRRSQSCLFCFTYYFMFRRK